MEIQKSKGFTPHHFLHNLFSFCRFWEKGRAMFRLKSIWKSGGGFTLIEALIAVSVLAIGIVGVLVMFPMGIQVAKSAQLSSIATQLGQEKIEEVISLPFGAILIGVTAETYGQILGFPAYRRATQISCFDPNGPVLFPNCPDTGMRKIKVEVFWRSPLGGVIEKSINIISLISER